jgi:hypothetical protein
MAWYWWIAAITIGSVILIWLSLEIATGFRGPVGHQIRYRRFMRERLAMTKPEVLPTVPKQTRASEQPT